MKMYVVAVHYTKLDKKNITGFRILDSDSRELRDFSYDEVRNVLYKKIAPIIGLAYDNAKNEIKGSNGSLDRYPALINGQLLNRSLVILNSIDDKGYQVSSFNGKVACATRNSVVEFAIKSGIANGKVVDKDGKKFISAINGSYSNIPFEKSDLYKQTNAKMKRFDTNIKKQLISNERAKISKRQSQYSIRPKVVTSTQIDPQLMQMVDDVSGQTVEQKMVYTMLALQAIRPFCYAMYISLNKVPTLDIDTMGVSLRTLYFNPYFILEMSLPELLFVTIHEIYHISMKHRIRQNGRRHSVWNKACDFYINKQIADEFGLTEQGDITQAKAEGRGNSNVVTNYKIGLPTTGCFNPAVDVDTDTPESLYEELLNIQNNKNNGGKSASGSDDGESKKDQSSNSSGDENGDENDQDKQGNNTSKDKKNSNNSKQNSSDGEQNSEEDKQNSDKSNTQNSELDDLADGNDIEQKTSTEVDDSGTDDANGDDGEENSQEADDLAGKQFRGRSIPNEESDIVESPDERGETSDRAEQIANSILKRAASICRQQKGSFGGEAGSWIERYVEKALAPKVLWQSLLKNKLTLASQKINTFTAPDKRFRSRGMILPGPKRLENDTLENVKVCIDASGSITNKDLGIALAQVEQLLNTFKADAELLYWDTQIRAIYPFKHIRDLVNKKPQGGGGTDANCIFKYFEESKEYKIGKKARPKIIIIFTDGYISTVDKKYSKYKDTIWVVVDNDYFEAPFGTKAPFKP